MLQQRTRVPEALWIQDKKHSGGTGDMVHLRKKENDTLGSDHLYSQLDKVIGSHCPKWRSERKEKNFVVDMGLATTQVPFSGRHWNSQSCNITTFRGSCNTDDHRFIRCKLSLLSLFIFFFFADALCSSVTSSLKTHNQLTSVDCSNLTVQVIKNNTRL